MKASCGHRPRCAVVSTADPLPGQLGHVPLHLCPAALQSSAQAKLLPHCSRATPPACAAHSSVLTCPAQTGSSSGSSFRTAYCFYIPLSGQPLLFSPLRPDSPLALVNPLEPCACSALPFVPLLDVLSVSRTVLWCLPLPCSLLCLPVAHSHAVQGRAGKGRRGQEEQGRTGQGRTEAPSQPLEHKASMCPHELSYSQTWCSQTACRLAHCGVDYTSNPCGHIMESFLASSRSCGESVAILGCWEEQPCSDLIENSRISTM